MKKHLKTPLFPLKSEPFDTLESVSFSFFAIGVCMMITCKKTYNKRAQFVGALSICFFVYDRRIIIGSLIGIFIV